MLTSTELSPNQGCRLTELKDACSILCNDFDELDNFIESYIHEVPIHTRDTEAADCDRFLSWLETQPELSAEQRDLIVDQQSRRAVVYVALKKRIAHLRFQEMLGQQKNANLEGCLSHYVHLNPVHVWGTFASHALLDEQTPIPATVLFFPNGDGVNTEVVDRATETVIHALECRPKKLRTVLKMFSRSERNSAIQKLSHFAEVGLLAVTRD